MEPGLLPENKVLDHGIGIHFRSKVIEKNGMT